MREGLIAAVAMLALSVTVMAVWAVICYARTKPEFPQPER